MAEAILMGRRVTATFDRHPTFKYPMNHTCVVDGQVVEFLGASSRRIFEFGEDKVLKLEHDGDQNYTEWRNWLRVKDDPEITQHLAACFDFVEFEADGVRFSVLVQERLTQINPSHSEYDECFYAVQAAFDNVYDLCKGQFKFDKDGRVRCHDYGC